MRMQFGTSSYERASGDLPELPVVNFYAEEAPSEETSIALQSRPGLEEAGSALPASVDQLFRRDGVLDGALLAVSDGEFYENGVSKGAVAGSGFVSIAGNEAGVAVTAGADMAYYDGSAYTTISFPDGADVAHVFAGGSRLWAVRADTGELYFSPALGNTFDPLDFVTAESLPDKLLQGLWIDDVAVLFGSESVEFWPNTGDADLPITPLEGRVFEKGLRATGCATVFGSTFAWVGNDNVVYLNGQEPQPISNSGLEAALAASETCAVYTFAIGGQTFLAVRLDTETHVFGDRARRWSRFESHGEDNWLPRCYADGVFGCSDGGLAQWSAAKDDFGGVMSRRFRGGFPLNSGGVDVSNIIVRCNVGQTGFLTGDYVNPTVEMRLSRDGGRTWGNWRGKSLGAQGAYRARVRWLACGMASQPGLLAEWRVSDPVDFRVSDVLLNEAFGGR